MNIGDLCPAGTEIKTEVECSEALNVALDLGITMDTSTPKNVTVASMGFLPYQCSYRSGGNQTFSFSSRKSDGPKLLLRGMHRMICRNGKIHFCIIMNFKII